MSYRSIVASVAGAPDGWSLKNLADVVSMKSGDGITSASISEIGEFPVFGGNGLRGFCGTFNREGECSLVGRQGALCGAVHHASGRIFASEHAIVCKAIGENCQLLVSHILKAMDLNGLSEASAQPGLSVEKLRKLPLLIPDNSREQEAIAEALSDADALIEGLERLIAKKRLIKRGAMQDLLTAKRRLPGFSGEWVERNLPELAEIKSGGTPSTTNLELWDGDIAWCTPTDITALDGSRYLSKTSRCITELGLRNSAAELLPEGAIVMTSRATIGECAIATVPMATNQGFKNFIPRSGTDRDFLFYLLSAQKADFIELCSGSTFLEIGMSQLRKYSVRTPAHSDEQAAIAGVLNDMDREIEALQARLEKARQVKEGMMQTLLTGRIRLV